MEAVQIIGFDPAYAKNFADLNYQWIDEAYGIEPHDRELLDHPFEQVIQPGGEVFFARLGDEAAGTVAMIPLGSDAFELAKMAVDPKYRGRGIGEKLMAACIEFARAEKRKRIILESNTKQAAAIRLYRKFGFEEIPLDPHSHYERANIRMELKVE